MSVCLHCNSRLGHEPDADAEAGRLLKAVEELRKETTVNPQAFERMPAGARALVADSLLRMAEQGRTRTIEALVLASAFAIQAGANVGIARNHGRIRHVSEDRKRVTDTGFEYRFSIVFELPRGPALSSVQISFPIHDSELGEFGHLQPVAWKGQEESEERSMAMFEARRSEAR